MRESRRPVDPQTRENRAALPEASIIIRISRRRRKARGVVGTRVLSNLGRGKKGRRQSKDAEKEIRRRFNTGIREKGGAVVEMLAS